MSQFITNLKSFLTNLHVSVPALLGFVFAAAPIWFPKYTDQLRATAALAIAYGLVASANSPTTPPTTPK